MWLPASNLGYVDINDGLAGIIGYGPPATPLEVYSPMLYATVLLHLLWHSVSSGRLPAPKSYNTCVVSLLFYNLTGAVERFEMQSQFSPSFPVMSPRTFLLRVISGNDGHASPHANHRSSERPIITLFYSQCGTFKAAFQDLRSERDQI